MSYQHVNELVFLVGLYANKSEVSRSKLVVLHSIKTILYLIGFYSIRRSPSQFLYSMTMQWCSALRLATMDPMSEQQHTAVLK